MEEYFIQSEEEMIALGKKMGGQISAGSCIALVGDLGAGKTHFTKGVCRSQGAVDSTSPTFTIVNEVMSNGLPIFHFDFYRLQRAEELYNLGWDDYLERGGVVVAEWANLFEEVIPDDALWVKIEHLENGRKVLIAW